MFESYGCAENIYVYWIHLVIFRNKVPKVNPVNELLPLLLMDVRLVQIACGTIGFDFIHEFTQKYLRLTIQRENPNQLFVENSRWFFY